MESSPDDHPNDQDEDQAEDPPVVVDVSVEDADNGQADNVGDQGGQPVKHAEEVMAGQGGT